MLDEHVFIKHATQKPQMLMLKQFFSSTLRYNLAIICQKTTNVLIARGTTERSIVVDFGIVITQVFFFLWIKRCKWSIGGKMSCPCTTSLLFVCQSEHRRILRIQWNANADGSCTLMVTRLTYKLFFNSVCQ